MEWCRKGEAEVVVVVAESLAVCSADATLWIDALRGNCSLSPIGQVCAKTSQLMLPVGSDASPISILP